MKYTFLLLSLLLAFHSQAQPSGTLLETAYQHRSTSKLKQFWQTYQQAVLPITATEVATLPLHQQQAYAVFTAFYKPHQLASLGGSEWGNHLYEHAQTLLVQTALTVKQIPKLYYTDTEMDSLLIRDINRNVENDSVRNVWLRTFRVQGQLSALTRRNYDLLGNSFFRGEQVEPLLVDSLTNFRPVVNVPGKRSIYLTPELTEVLTRFLGNQHTPLGQGGSMHPARAKQESHKRQAFLERELKIWYGHWGGYWQLPSYPLVSSITFDQDMTYARVSFRMVYEGGQAILKRVNNQWTMVWVQRTWIE